MTEAELDRLLSKLTEVEFGIAFVACRKALIPHRSASNGKGK